MGDDRSTYINLQLTCYLWYFGPFCNNSSPGHKHSVAEVLGDNSLVARLSDTKVSDKLHIHGFGIF